MSHVRLKSRMEIPRFLNKLNLIGEAVEVGVREGDHALFILSQWKGQILHMVDPWEHQDEKVYADSSNVDTNVQE